MRRWLICAGLVVSSLVRAVASGEEDPYVYQRLPISVPARVEIQSAVGTRDGRPFGERGVEETVRTLFLPLDRLELVASGGVLVLGDQTRAAGAIEASLLALGDRATGLSLGAGYAYDFRGASLVRARAAAFARTGGVDVAASALAEMPIDAPDRDSVDVIVGVAASVPLSDRLRAGVELLGEDLEVSGSPTRPRAAPASSSRRRCGSASARAGT